MMVNLPFQPPNIRPRTLEEAQWVQERAERERAMERGDWLPDGWTWVDDLHHRVPRDSVGAWAEQPNILVWVRPPEWTCWKCGTKDRLDSPCLATDFLGLEDQREKYNEWVWAQLEGAILQVHGVGAPKVIFDMVWNRWVHRLMAEAPK